MIVVVFGASGSGKSTVGSALADRLGWRFIDADSYHSPASVDRIRAGLSLEDEDRWPWLHRLHEELAAAAGRCESIVLACSALKATYRRILRGDLDDVRFVYLDAPAAVLRSRLERRSGHFAGVDILEDQLCDVEVPGDDEIGVDATLPPEAMVSAIRRALAV
jgi:carbohydrate kinase (thermoresistant glucokinase family)